MHEIHCYYFSQLKSMQCRLVNLLIIILNIMDNSFFTFGLRSSLLRRKTVLNTLVSCLSINRNGRRSRILLGCKRFVSGWRRFVLLLGKEVLIFEEFVIIFVEFLLFVMVIILIQLEVNNYFLFNYYNLVLNQNPNFHYIK